MSQPETSSGVRFPPPLIYLGFLLLGLWAESWMGPVAFGPARPVLLAIGLPPFLAGTGLILAAVGLFRRAGTPPEPWRPTTRIVAEGIYRRTRNPMYLGMALIHAGLAVALDSPLALLLLAPALLLIRTYVIAREERYLEARFGESYAAYKARVRRWI